MPKLKEHLQKAMLKLYGADQEELDECVSNLEKRIEKRRRKREAAGMDTRSKRRYTAKEYEDWMNLHG